MGWVGVFALEKSKDCGKCSCDLDHCHRDHEKHSHVCTLKTKKINNQKE